MNRWVTLGLALAGFAALLLRWPHADQRPMHNDEAVNGLKFARLWERGEYRYDPNEHHGPSLYYFTSAFAKISGAPASASAVSEARLRWVTVVFGVGLICLLPLLVDGLGRAGVLWAGIFTAVSSAFVFYSQYYIHEMLMVFFAAGVLAFSWRYWRSRHLAWAIAAGISLGLMAATKETFVISIAAAAGAIVMNQLWNRLLDATETPARAAPLNYWHLAFAAGATLISSVVFFSSFFTNWAGLLDAVRTYEPWLARAGGNSPHLHPWYFYFHRLLWFDSAKGPLWTESLILVLSLVAAIAAFRRKGLGDARASFLRFLSLYSFLLAGMYAGIWYKTPWCLLNFWHGFILLAGAGAALLVRSSQPWLKPVTAGALIAGTIHLGFQAYRSVNTYAADRKNPYVYAQTLPNLLRLADRIYELASYAERDETLVKVAAAQGDYWPLPWYLRRYSNVGWWNALPPDPYAPLMVVSADLNAALDDKGTHLMIGYFELRPSVFLEFYVELNLWTKYLEQRSRPPPDPE